MAIIDDTTSSPVKNPPATAASSPPRTATEGPVDDRKPAQPSIPIASPAHSTAQPESAQGAPSPGQGSGTKRAEAEAARTSTGGGDNIMTQMSPPNTNSPPPAQSIYPITASQLVGLESKSMSELCDEYFTRVAQHARIEAHMTRLMHKRHEVYTHLTHEFCFFHPRTL